MVGLLLIIKRHPQFTEKAMSDLKVAVLDPPRQGLTAEASHACSVGILQSSVYAPAKKFIVRFLVTVDLDGVHFTPCMERHGRRWSLGSPGAWFTSHATAPPDCNKLFAKPVAAQSTQGWVGCC